MMNREEIFIKIRDNTAEVLGIEKTEIEMNSEFKNDLGCDSLMLLDLIMEFENRFEMRIPDKEAEGFSNISSVVDYVYKRSHDT